MPHSLHLDSLLSSLHETLNALALDPRYHDALTLLKGVRNGIVYGTKVRFPHALVTILLFRHGSLRQKLLLVLQATRAHARNLGLFCLVYKVVMLVLRKGVWRLAGAGGAGGGNGKEGREGHYDAFIAGLVGGYTVFGRGANGQSAVSQQIVIYVFARVVLAYAKLLVQPRGDFKGERGHGHAHGHGHSHSHSHGHARGHSRSGVVGGGGGWGLISDPALAEKVKNNAWPVFASLSWALVMYVFRWHPETVQPSLRSSMHYIYEQSDHWDSLRTLIWHNK